MEGLAERVAAESVRVQQPLVDAGDLRAVSPGHGQPLAIERFQQRDEARRVPLGVKAIRVAAALEAADVAHHVRHVQGRVHVGESGGEDARRGHHLRERGAQRAQDPLDTRGRQRRDLQEALHDRQLHARGLGPAERVGVVVHLAHVDRGATAGRAQLSAHEEGAAGAALDE